MTRHILVVGDSLAYHGPDRPHVLTDARLWPNVMATGIGLAGGVETEVDLVARLGWTARDAWWAVTKDPAVWGRLLPRADGLVLAVGGMDQLPAAVPTYLRDGIPYVRPAAVRRRVRNAYRRLSPRVIRMSGGWMRQLPQGATDHYLARITSVARHFNPDIPVVLIAPGIHRASAYPSDRHHPGAIRAARAWVRQHGTGYVEVDDFILPSLSDGSANPDGIHYSWRTHQLIGEAVGEALLGQGFAQLDEPARRRYNHDLDTTAIGL
ncbi:MAG: SGNH/GDSL hydrolase family protein [Actinomycetes bacterium]